MCRIQKKKNIIEPICPQRKSNKAHKHLLDQKKLYGQMRRQNTVEHTHTTRTSTSIPATERKTLAI